MKMITMFLKYKFKNLYLKIPILRNNIMKNNLNSLELQKYIEFIQSKNNNLVKANYNDLFSQSKDNEFKSLDSKFKQKNNKIKKNQEEFGEKKLIKP